MILSKKGNKKGADQLRGCPGWSVPVLFANSRTQVFSRQGPAPVLFANPRRQVFSRQGPYLIKDKIIQVRYMHSQRIVDEFVRRKIVESSKIQMLYFRKFNSKSLNW